MWQAGKPLNFLAALFCVAQHQRSFLLLPPYFATTTSHPPTYIPYPPPTRLKLTSSPSFLLVTPLVTPPPPSPPPPPPSFYLLHTFTQPPLPAAFHPPSHPPTSSPGLFFFLSSLFLRGAGKSGTLLRQCSHLLLSAGTCSADPIVPALDVEEGFLQSSKRVRTFIHPSGTSCSLVSSLFSLLNLYPPGTDPQSPATNPFTTITTFLRPFAHP